MPQKLKLWKIHRLQMSRSKSKKTTKLSSSTTTIQLTDKSVKAKFVKVINQKGRQYPEQQEELECLSSVEAEIGVEGSKMKAHTRELEE